MKVVWFFPPSKFEGEIPLVSQNRWFKYLPMRTNFIYPVIAATGATMIKQAGHEVKFLDCPAMELSFEDAKCDLEGADLIIMEARTAIMNWIWQITKEIKEFSKAKIAYYGDHVIVKPQESLRNGADYIIRCGDYDYGAYLLCEELDKSGGDCKKIFEAPLFENLDKLPFIDRELVPWKLYFETWRHSDAFGWIQSGRGCPYRCSFCSWVYTFYHHTIRVMSPKRVADEMQFATEKYGIREYLDDADTFLCKWWGVKFAEELKQRGLDIFWNMQTRPDQITSVSLEELKFMKKSGLHVVKLGVDASNDETMTRIRKNISIKQVKDAVELLKKAGLEVHVNMIIGYPWEDRKTAYDGIKFVKNLKPNQAQFSLIEPFIGTPIFDEALANNWFIHDPYDYDKYDMKTPIVAGEMTEREIAKLHRDAWSMFYLNPSFITRQIIKSFKHMLEHRNIDSFKHLWRGFKGVYYGHMRAVK